MSVLILDLFGWDYVCIVIIVWMNWGKVISKEGRWEWYSKYIEQNCFSHFLSMQLINRCNLAMVALKDCQGAMVARGHLLIHWMQRKQSKQFSSMNGIHSLPF